MLQPSVQCFYLSSEIFRFNSRVGDRLFRVTFLVCFLSVARLFKLYHDRLLPFYVFHSQSTIGRDRLTCCKPAVSKINHTAKYKRTQQPENYKSKFHKFQSSRSKCTAIKPKATQISRGRHLDIILD
jgi:hypothetical protein